MPRVFISNSNVQDSGDIIVDASFDVLNFIEAQHKDGSTIFVIDVHCKFKQADKMQQQGGVIVYRNLLKEFAKSQDKLKVVFYSPIPKEDLVKLKPENYVLALLPFVELFPDIEHYGIKPEDWTFEKALTEAEKKVCPQFNNASENLLSGWSLNDENKVEVKKKQIVFVDDQANEWVKAFEKVFKLGKGGATVPLIFAYNKNGSDKVFSLDKLDKSFSESVREADLVISDFYLEENHEFNNWMSAEELSKKSGFQLFQAIKGTNGIHKGVPIVMHTSSNKIQYYKFLDANGVDNWLVKDTRPNTTNQEKKENFNAFKTVIEQFTIGDSAKLYSTLKQLWEKIELIEQNSNSNWWYSNSINSKITKVTYNTRKRGTTVTETTTIKSANIQTKQTVLSILKDSWMALRALLNKEDLFATSIGSSDKNFTAAAICNNLGKLFEFFGFNQSIDYNYFFKLFYCIRNAASHYNDYSKFTKEDCILYFECWLSILQSADNSFENIFRKNSPAQIEQIIQDTSFEYNLLYCYMQYFNSEYSKNHLEIKELLGRRIQSLFDKANYAVMIKEITGNTGQTIPGTSDRAKNLKGAVADISFKGLNGITLTQGDKRIFKDA